MSSNSKPEVTSTTADFSLKKKLGPDVNIREAFTEDVIAAADSVIEESKKDFFTDAEQDVAAMEEAYSAASSMPENTEKAKDAVKIIERISHSLKGQSETLGFDLLAHASKSLYTFCSQVFRAGEGEQFIVVRKHLDTIQLIVRERMQGDGGAIGKELVRSLQLLTEKYNAA